MQRKSKRKSVRKFIPPEPHELNFDANDLIELVNWDTISKSKLTTPPILDKLYDEDLHNSISKNTVFRGFERKKIPNLKCHSQDCECNIYFTSKSILIKCFKYCLFSQS